MDVGKKLSGLAHFYQRVTKWIAMFAGVCVMLMMCYITPDVAGRYLLNKPLPASFEIVTSLMVFVVFLALAYTQVTTGHLRLEFLRQRYSSRWLAITDAFFLIVFIAFISLIIWQSWLWTSMAWKLDERMHGAWRIPFLPSKLALTLGLILLWVQLVIDFIRRIRQLAKVGQAGTER